MRQERVRGVPSMGGVDTLILTASWRGSCAGTKERTQRVESWLCGDHGEAGSRWLGAS